MARHIDEDKASFLFFLFILSVVAWTVFLVVANLPKMIGSVLFEWIGKFPFNLGTFCILWWGGFILLFILVRVLARKPDEEELENGII